MEFKYNPVRVILDADEMYTLSIIGEWAERYAMEHEYNDLPGGMEPGETQSAHTDRAFCFAQIIQEIGKAVKLRGFMEPQQDK